MTAIDDSDHDSDDDSDDDASIASSTGSLITIETQSLTTNLALTTTTATATSTITPTSPNVPVHTINLALQETLWEARTLPCKQPNNCHVLI
jgi:hypothetical protein